MCDEISPFYRCQWAIAYRLPVPRLYRHTYSGVSPHAPAIGLAVDWRADLARPGGRYRWADERPGGSRAPEAAPEARILDAAGRAAYVPTVECPP